MNGIEMSELTDLISRYHEAEFEYNGKIYVLQPEVDEGKDYLVIWDITPGEIQCIARRTISWEGGIPSEIIDDILSEPCFDGKSFMDIEKDITVTYIY